jgi:hypothetical protein
MHHDVENKTEGAGSEGRRTEFKDDCLACDEWTQFLPRTLFRPPVA